MEKLGRENDIDIGGSHKDRDMAINKRNHEVTNKMGDEKHFSPGRGEGPTIVHKDSTVNQTSIGKLRFCQRYLSCMKQTIK